MKPAVARLALAALLFVCWIGYLAYQVVTLPRTPTGQPLVLSRPQLLVSDLDVLAPVDSLNDEESLVEQVLYTDRKEYQGLTGKKFRITNLAECRGLYWTGPGRYLLPLRPISDGKDNKEGKEWVFEVVPTPPSPGYPPLSGKAGPPRIYPATDQVLAQYHRIHKPSE
jgi:hypothetical protein